VLLDELNLDLAVARPLPDQIALAIAVEIADAGDVPAGPERVIGDGAAADRGRIESVRYASLPR